MASIEFHYPEGMDGVFPSPIRASKAMPQYFKALPKEYDSGAALGGKTVKKCVPFIEAMSAGYIIPLWSDMHVWADNGALKVDFPPNLSVRPSLEQHRYEQMPDHPLAAQPYGKHFMKLMNPWVVKTSEGVSCLFTSPMNHMETRLKILDGVVDCDSYYNNVNFPFVWTGGDGKFLIRKGTPIVQVIPFVRSDFDFSVSAIDEEARNRVTGNLGTAFADVYRQDYWHKNNEELPQ